MLLYAGFSLDLQLHVALGLSFWVQLLRFAVPLDLRMSGVHRKHQCAVVPGSACTEGLGQAD